MTLRNRAVRHGPFGPEISVEDLRSLTGKSAKQVHEAAKEGNLPLAFRPYWRGEGVSGLAPVGMHYAGDDQLVGYVDKVSPSLCGLRR